MCPSSILGAALTLTYRAWSGSLLKFHLDLLFSLSFQAQ